MIVFWILWATLVPLLVAAPWWGSRIAEWLSELFKPAKWDAAKAIGDTAIALLNDHFDEWTLIYPYGEYSGWEHTKTGIVIERPSDADNVQMLANGVRMKLPRRYNRDIHRVWTDRRERAAMERVREAVSSVRDRMRVYQGGKA